MATHNQPSQSNKVLRRLKSAKHGFNLEAGGAVVEFALVLPVLLLIFFGIIELSVGLYDQALLTNASREAARAGVVYQLPRKTEAEIIDVATDCCLNHLITFGPAATPQVSVPDGTAGSRLTVNVTYNYQGLVLGALIRQFTGPVKISAATTMTYE